MVYLLRKSYTRDYLLIRGVVAGGRIADYKRYIPESQVAEFDGNKFLITHRLAKVGTCVRELTPYTGRFPRIVLFFRNFVDTIKGLN